MTYGLDMDEVRYETDHHGNRLKVTIPYAMFSALTEFWIAARRAQTASLEQRARPGQIKGSLQAHVPSGDAPPAETPPPPRITKPGPARSDQRWQQLLQKLPDDPNDSLSEIISPALSLVEPEAAPRKSKSPRVPVVFFAREFVAPIPDEVAKLIHEGVYFIAAWRQYRELTQNDTAELLSRNPETVRWHEHGYNKPSPRVLQAYADVFDCHVDQLTVKPGSNTQPWLSVVHSVTPSTPPRAEPRAPADTDYPDAVLAHLLAGKTPMTAWRLYRGLSVKELAEQYGSKLGNMKAMEQQGHVKKKTIDKLCPIFHCKPEQLLRPEGMPMPGEVESPSSKRITEAAQSQVAYGR